MPPSRRSWLVLRFHQANGRIVAAQEYLASVLVTLESQHSGLTSPLLAIINDLERARADLRDFAIPTFTRTLRDLHKAGDLARMLADAEPVPDPHYHSQTYEHQRDLPCRDPARRKALEEAGAIRWRETHPEPTV